MKKSSSLPKLFGHWAFKYLLSTVLIVIMSLNVPLLSKFSKHKSALYHANCSILNEKRESLFNMTGQLCDFLPDGRSLVFQKDVGPVIDRLYLYDAHQNVVWEKSVDLHHVLKFSKDQQSFFMMTYEKHEFNQGPFLFDVISKVDLDGVVTHRWSTYEVKDDATLACSHFPRTYNDSERPGMKEFTHLNSLYEIPDNPLAKKYEWMRQGNLIVNMLGLNVFAFFSPDLKLLKTMPYSKDCFGVNHDAQILPNGHLLLFRNSVGLGVDQSDVVEMDLFTNEIIRRVPVPYSSIRGSVQLLENNHLLITESYQGGRAFEVDASGEMVMEMTNPINNRKTDGPVIFQFFRERSELKAFLNKQLN